MIQIKAASGITLIIFTGAIVAVLGIAMMFGTASAQPPVNAAQLSQCLFILENTDIQPGNADTWRYIRPIMQATHAGLHAYQGHGDYQGNLAAFKRPRSPMSVGNGVDTLLNSGTSYIIKPSGTGNVIIKMEISLADGVDSAMFYLVVEDEYGNEQVIDVELDRASGQDMFTYEENAIPLIVLVIGGGAAAAAGGYLIFKSFFKKASYKPISTPDCSPTFRGGDYATCPPTRCDMEGSTPGTSDYSPVGYCYVNQIMVGGVIEDQTSDPDDWGGVDAANCRCYGIGEMAKGWGPQPHELSKYD